MLIFIALGIPLVALVAYVLFRADPSQHSAALPSHTPTSSPLPEAPPLRLGAEQGDAFLGALVVICRADGRMTSRELDALRAVAARHGLNFDESSLTFNDYDVARLPELVRSVTDAPFRAAATSPPREIAERFLEAARWVAGANGPPDDATEAILQDLRRTLDAATTKH